MDRPHSSEAPLPEHCVLAHRIFTALGEVSFRRAETDGAPVMAITLGEREATVPLRSLQREFAIAEDSPDGRMLALVTEALDHVSCIQLGDRFPSEVLTGEASWEPQPQHRQQAARRLQMHLLAWLYPGANRRLANLDDDPVLRQQVQQAFSEAATRLGLAGPAEVVALVEALSAELAYIEALRENLLDRVCALAARVQRIEVGHRGDQRRMEQVTQVKRLTAIAQAKIAGRFADVDAQTAEILVALSNIESHNAFIRSNRDLLYRSQRAWQPLLDDWLAAGEASVEKLWALIGRSYQFLAPRFMPVTEWQAASRRQLHGAQLQGAVMSW